MKIIKLKGESFLEKEKMLDDTRIYSNHLSTLLINLAVDTKESGAKQLRNEKRAYPGNAGMLVD